MDHLTSGTGDDGARIGNLDNRLRDLNIGGNRARPRMHDDEDDGSDYEDDDLESTMGGPANGNQKGEEDAEDEKELPEHACA